MRPPHFRITKEAPDTWQVWVVVADGRWTIATETTATRAWGVVATKLAERRPVMEVTA